MERYLSRQCSHGKSLISTELVINDKKEQKEEEREETAGTEERRIFTQSSDSKNRT